MPSPASRRPRSRSDDRDVHLAVAASCFTFVLGLWLVVAPDVIGFSDAGGTARVAARNDVVAGLIVAVLSAGSAAAPVRLGRLGLLTALAGLWLVLTPVLVHGGEVPRASANDVVTGALILLAATGSVLAVRG
jgi:hypothetical protein